MNKYMEKMKEITNKYKKRLIIGTSVFVIAIAGLGIGGVAFIYNKAEANINYTPDQAKEIALKAVPGEVLKVDKRLELDEFSFEYKVKIKDANNILRKVTVNASLGAITDFDNYYD